jgi:hypothetical protein
MKADIDKHILSEIVMNQQELKKQISNALKTVEMIMQLHSRNDALYSHLVGEIEKVGTERNSYTGKGVMKHQEFDVSSDKPQN